MIKKNLNKILIAVSLLLGVLAIVMLCAAGIAPKSDYKKVLDSYSMAKITFGYKTHGIEVFKFSFPNLLTYILIVAGLVCAVLALLGKGGKITAYVAAGLFLVGGVLYLCAGKLLNSTSDATEFFTIGVGSLLGGIFSILAAVAVLVPTFLKN